MTRQEEVVSNAGVVDSYEECCYAKEVSSNKEEDLQSSSSSSSSAPVVIREEEFYEPQCLIPPNDSSNECSELFSKASPLLEAIRMKFRQGRAGGRKRYCQSYYDLDFTMITSRIIATSLPTLNWFVGYFRNDANVLAKFMEEMYGRDNYMIYNLSEFRYEKQVFNGKVIDLNFPDHYNPPLDMLMMTCKSIQDWLQRDEKNVALIHCAGGKGRTGTFICSYLLYCSLFNDAIDALSYFALMRMEKPVNPFSVCQNGGINSPSQTRYITYVQHLLENKFGSKALRHSTTNPQSYLYNSTIFENNNLFLKNHCNIPYKRRVKLDKILIREPSQQIIDHVQHNLFHIEISQLTTSKIEESHSGIRSTLEINDYEVSKNVLLTMGLECCEIGQHLLTFTLSEPLSLSGDVIVILRMKNHVKMKEFSRIGFHTAFIVNEKLSLSKSEIDGVHRRETVGSDFGMEFHFGSMAYNQEHEIVDQQEYSSLSYSLENVYTLPETPSTLTPQHVFLFEKDYHFTYHRYLKSLSVENELDKFSPSIIHSQQVVHPRPMKLKVKLVPTLHEMDHSKGKFISVTITIG